MICPDSLVVNRVDLVTEVIGGVRTWPESFNFFTLSRVMAAFP
jgi:hypothetical protein